MILKILYGVISLLIVFLLFWRLWFLRDPPRTIPPGKSIVSPADGRINTIIRGNNEKESINKGFMGKINTLSKEVADNYIVVNIVMSPLDVHVQRVPIDGEVIRTRYMKGRFSNAMKKGIAINNEKNEILIQGEKKIKVVQIAGVLARRISCFVKKNQKLIKGERIGLINLGSQVTLILPADVKLSVRQGQRVKGGETVIGV